MFKSPKAFFRQPTVRNITYIVLALTTFSAAYLILVMVQALDVTALGLQAGKVAPQDILAPFTLAYESEVLTTQQKDIAAQSVNPAYTPADPRIARQQVDELRAVLGYISTLRDDPIKTEADKLAEIAVNEDYTIPPELAAYMIDIPEETWQAIQSETILVLQQVMRAAIRETNLEDAKRTIPALVNFSLPVEVAEAAAEMVGLFTVPNSFYSEELTQARRQTARDAVKPVLLSFIVGETLIQRGRVISQADIEALKNFGLLTTTDDRLRKFSALALTTAAGVFSIAALYLTDAWKSLKRLGFIAVYLLLFLALARGFTIGHVILPYLFPVTAFGIILANFMGSPVGLMMLLPLSLLISFEMPNPLELATYYIFTGMLGIMVLGKARRVTSYFWAGLASGLMGIILILAFRITDPFTDFAGLVMLSGVALANGIISAGLAIVLQFFSARYLGMTTPLQLVDLSRPDQPLLRKLLTTAPGTYQHSLQVANMAEQAAELIGADTLLTRVGALYHDIGKTANPLFFIENQIPGSPNPHDSLSPEASSRIIIQHVLDGLVMAKKNHIPTRIQEFISEHHGTTMTRYQYGKAVQAAGSPDQVDENRFRYPGPKPKSRETALVMLADGCEARARAERPKGETELRTLIKDVIDKRLSGGQLSDTQVTTSDLHIIIDSYTTTLQAIYHPRIEYPKLEAATPGPQLSAVPEDKETTDRLARIVPDGSLPQPEQKASLPAPEAADEKQP